MKSERDRVRVEVVISKVSVRRASESSIFGNNLLSRYFTGFARHVDRPDREDEEVEILLRNVEPTLRQRPFPVDLAHAMSDRASRNVDVEERHELAEDASSEVEDPEDREDDR